MPKRIPTHRSKNAPTRKERNAEWQAHRVTTDPIQRMYNTPRWKALRLLILSRDPYCARCLAEGVATPSDTVNHITKARDEPERFYDETNLEGVCASHHSRDIQREERKASATGRIFRN